MIELKQEKKLEETGKTFKNLEEEVIKLGKCCSCGACVAYCESQKFNVIEMNGYTPIFKSESNIENCTKCQLCYFICPQTSELMSKLNEKWLIRDEIGNIIDLIAAKTNNENTKKYCQDGGIVSTILSYLFEKGKIDGAIVSLYDENFKPFPKLIFNQTEVLNSAGTRYSISSNLLPLKETNNLPADVIKEKKIYDIDKLNVAFIGTPCQCRAISKMKFLNIKPAHIVKYVISLFCFENFDYDKLMKKLNLETKLKPEDIKKTLIKKNFFVISKGDKKFEIDIKKLNDAVRSHCHECKEFTGMFSDISVGASGAPEGHSMIIIRTDIGAKLIKSLISQNLIEPFTVPIEESNTWKSKKINWFKKMISFKQ